MCTKHEVNRGTYVEVISIFVGGIFWGHPVVYSFGFGFVWENQGVQNQHYFVKVFKQRLFDCHDLNSHAHTDSMPIDNARCQSI